MQAPGGPFEVNLLLLETALCRAHVDGDPVDLPPKEFHLLAELAARPGEPINARTLIEEVWPENPLMTPQDLYWYIWRLRKRLGDDGRTRKLIGIGRASGISSTSHRNRLRSTGDCLLIRFPRLQRLPMALLRTRWRFLTRELRREARWAGRPHAGGRSAATRRRLRQSSLQSRLSRGRRWLRATRSRDSGRLDRAGSWLLPRRRRPR